MVRALLSLLLLSVGLVPAQLLAQPSTSSAPHLTGTVVDPSGAFVPAAEVTVTGPTGAARLATTDAAGRFDLPVPGIGPFTITVVVPGFSPAVVADAEAGPPVSITLQAATIEEHVDVVSTTRRSSVTTTATKLDTPLLQVPQTIDVVGAEVLRQQAAASLGDALRNVAGVSVNLGEGRRDQFIIRGFSAQNDTLLDGTRDDAPYYRDVATVERIEVLKGPAAALFGRGSSGGVINRILKTPRAGAPIAEASFSVGSLGTRRFTGDVGRALSDSVSVRAAAAAEDSTSFRDDAFVKRLTVAPSLRWSGSATSALLQVELLRDSRLPDRGIPSMNGRPADVRIGQSFGFAADDFIDTSVATGSLRVEHRTTRGWLLRQVVRVGVYDTSFSNTAATGTSLVSGAWRVNRQQYNAEQSQQNVFSQSEAVMNGRLARMQHLLLSGVEIGTQRRNTIRFNGTAGPVMLFDPQPVRPIYSTTATTYNRFDGTTLALYAQDQISMGTRWRTLVGVRGDRFGQRLDDRRPDDLDLTRTDVSWSPRAGLVFQPTKHSSLYASVSRSFQPSGEGLSLAVNAAELKPESSRNIEAGTKIELLDARATATLSVFRLDRSNIKTTDPVDPTKLVLVGQQRTNGVEAAFEGQLYRRIRAQAGVALLDAAVLRSNTVTSGVRIEGNRPGLVPRASGHLWVHYLVTSRLAFAGGLTHNGLRYTSNDNLVILPGYTRTDAAVTYRTGRVELAINARNLLGTRHYETASSNYQIMPGTPRDLLVTLRVIR